MVLTAAAGCFGAHLHLLGASSLLELVSVKLLVAFTALQKMVVHLNLVRTAAPSTVVVAAAAVAVHACCKTSSCSQCPRQHTTTILGSVNGAFHTPTPHQVILRSDERLMVRRRGCNAYDMIWMSSDTPRTDFCARSDGSKRSAQRGSRSDAQ